MNERNEIRNPSGIAALQQQIKQGDAAAESIASSARRPRMTFEPGHRAPRGAER
jgi:hypothetical protein